MTDTTKLRDAVAARIVELKPGILDRVADIQAAGEIDKVVEAVIKGDNELKIIERDLKKLDRPDAVYLNRDKSVASETYTKARLDEIEKLEKRRDKLVRALDKAIGGDTNDLTNLNKPEKSE